MVMTTDRQPVPILAEDEVCCSVCGEDGYQVRTMDVNDRGKTSTITFYHNVCWENLEDAGEEVETQPEAT
jgi:hypothetical protein